LKSPVAVLPDVGTTFRERQNKLSLSQRRQERATREASTPGETRTADEIYTDIVSRANKAILRQRRIEHIREGAPPIDVDLVLQSREYDTGLIDWHNYNQLYLNKYHTLPATYDRDRVGEFQRDNTPEPPEHVTTMSPDNALEERNANTLSVPGSPVSTASNSSIPDPIVEAYDTVRSVIARFNPGGSPRGSDSDIQSESEFLARVVQVEKAVCLHICPLPVHVFINDLHLA
jgi:hypothetical protein